MSAPATVAMVWPLPSPIWLPAAAPATPPRICPASSSPITGSRSAGAGRVAHPAASPAAASEITRLFATLWLRLLIVTSTQGFSVTTTWRIPAGRALRFVNGWRFLFGTDAANEVMAPHALQHELVVFDGIDPEVEHHEHRPQVGHVALDLVAAGIHLVARRIALIPERAVRIEDVFDALFLPVALAQVGIGEAPGAFQILRRQRGAARRSGLRFGGGRRRRGAGGLCRALTGDIVGRHAGLRRLARAAAGRDEQREKSGGSTTVNRVHERLPCSERRGEPGKRSPLTVYQCTRMAPLSFRYVNPFGARAEDAATDGRRDAETAQGMAARAQGRRRGLRRPGIPQAAGALVNGRCAQL